MTTKQKVIVGVSSLVFLGGVAYLIYYLSNKKEPVKGANSIEPTKGSTPSTSTTNSAPVANAAPAVVAPKMIYANKDGVNVYSIYDSKILKTAKKGELVGRWNGDWNKDAYAVTGTFGKGWITKVLVTVK